MSAANQTCHDRHTNKVAVTKLGSVCPPSKNSISCSHVIQQAAPQILPGYSTTTPPKPVPRISRACFSITPPASLSPAEKYDRTTPFSLVATRRYPANHPGLSST